MPEPSTKTEYYVSYAWNDDTPGSPEREAFVDQLCAAAEKKGIKIIRDKTAMRYGDRISKFMSRIAHGDRIFIVLSDKYLKSAYCMHELFDVWRNCREDDAEFIKRTRVYELPCAKLSTGLDRAQYAIYWRKKFEEMDAFVKEHGQLVLSDEDNAEYRLMTRFVNETANILKLVQDVLRPRYIRRVQEIRLRRSAAALTPALHGTSALQDSVRMLYQAPSDPICNFRNSS